MAKLLFRLNGVTEEEADFVREALDNAGIDYYETSQGRWGISLAAIWLKNNDDYPAVRELLDNIQQDWLEKIRDQPVATTAERFRENPLRFLVTLLAVAAIVGLTIVPFLGVFD